MGNKRPSPTGHRVFFALPISADLGAQLDAWRLSMPITGRLVPIANLHLTLAFLGEVDANRLDELLDCRFDGFQPFSLQFGELAYFSRAKVLSVTPHETPPALQRLAERCQHIQQRIGNARKEHRYQPHITLARDVEPPVPSAAMPLQMEWRCNTVQLMESRRHKQGVIYQSLAEWPLRPPLRPQPR